MSKISIIGSGSWGTALAWLLSNNKHDVTLWSFLAEEFEMYVKYRENVDKLPGVKLPLPVKFTTDLKEASSDADLIVMAVPSIVLRTTSGNMSKYVKNGQLIVNVAKGIEESSLKTMSEVIKDEIPHSDVAVLSGPSHAEEVGKGLPTAVVAGAYDHNDALRVQNIFTSPVFRVYTSSDMLGIEIGGALKNVIALAAGIADGLGFGDNTKAALVTRGIAEIARLGSAMGAEWSTFAGLSGIGDLVVTCASMNSRNRRAGILIGKGYSMQSAMDEVHMVVEGVYSAKAAFKLAKKYDVEMPIVAAVNEVLFENKSAREAVMYLMQRVKKEEI